MLHLFCLVRLGAQYSHLTCKTTPHHKRACLQQHQRAYEDARIKVQKFINANYSYEVIFTSGATGAINMLATSFGDTYIEEGDEILVSTMEHHSNIVPWQMMCKRKKAVLKVIPM